MRSVSLREALAEADPFLMNSVDQLSPGANALTFWAMNRLRWADVDANETSYGQAMKDPVANRGKRFCVTARVNQIEAVRHAEGVFWEGTLSPSDVQWIRFRAVGSSGAIVTEHQARFCGVVLEGHQFNNALGGVTPAVAVLGMFDLPENRRPQ
jgi:hypothetical protein